MNNSVVVAGIKFGYGMALGMTAALVSVVFIGAYGMSFVDTIKAAAKNAKKEEVEDGSAE